jgi:hypothetical protein
MWTTGEGHPDVLEEPVVGTVVQVNENWRYQCEAADPRSADADRLEGPAPIQVEIDANGTGSCDPVHR